MDCILENITVYYEVFAEGWKRVYIGPPGYDKAPGKDWITNQDKGAVVVEEFSHE
jgi:hypothetical protein